MKKESQYKICVLIFSDNVSEIFIVLSRIHGNIIVKVFKSSCKVPVILVRCY
jgi:hypothetical protein